MDYIWSSIIENMKINTLILIGCFVLIQGVANAQNDTTKTMLVTKHDGPSVQDSLHFVEKKISLFNNLYMGGEYGVSPGYRNFIQGGAWLQLDHDYFKIMSAVAADPATAEQKQLHKNHSKDCNCIETRQLSDVSLIYGKSYRFFKICQIQFGAGLAFVSKTDKDEAFNAQKHEFEPERYKKRGTVGIPAEARFAIQFKRYFSISCTAHVNANPIKSFRGISAGVALGLF